MCVALAVMKPKAGYRQPVNELINAAASPDKATSALLVATPMLCHSAYSGAVETLTHLGLKLGDVQLPRALY